MRGALSLGRILGINVYIHFTFLLIFAWVGYTTWHAGGDLMRILFECAMVLAVFACVVLHEFGHALAARRYGIGTRKIVLLPIGGVAQLEHMPEKPGQELVVALAGPAVNVVIAAVLLPIVLLLYPAHSLFQEEQVADTFLIRLVWYNVVLLVFNLIPAFPMDGGRVLRALLGMRLGFPKATKIAARIGQALSIGFVIAGFYANPMWILLGVFVFTGAEMELRMVTERFTMRGLIIRQAMLRQFSRLELHDALKKAAQLLLSGTEKDFLVVDDQQRVAGVLTRDILIQSLSAGGPEQFVGSVMKTGLPYLHPETPLDEALQLMRLHQTSVLPVYEGPDWIGIAEKENITEILLLQSALSKSAAS